MMDYIAEFVNWIFNAKMLQKKYTIKYENHNKH